jgi:hypothetical protein
VRASIRLASTLLGTLALASALGLGTLGCGAPLAAPLVAPLVADALAPQALAAPTEDGSIYVLAEGGPASSMATLRSLWRREAGKACQGDYMVMSESSAQSRRAGLTSRKLHEGYVRCVSPEAAADLAE